jgi:hypothetical protein
MKIACLGWGSLIWSPRSLPIQQRWFQDGPLLPIELTRHSQDGRITLVITPGVREVRSLWTRMMVPSGEVAIRKLAEREGIQEEHSAQYIGYWVSTGFHRGQSAETIGRWAECQGLDAVVWTNLPPRFHNEVKVPSSKDVLDFLRNQPPEVQKRAEEYIRKAPRQIDTDYRRCIEAELNWTPMPEEEN